MKGSWIICLGAGLSQLPLIREARRLGHRVVVVDRNEQAAGFLEADYAIHCSTYETEKVLDLLSQSGLRITGMLARTTGRALFTAAAIAERYSIPGPDQQLAELCTSKSAMKTFLRTHSLRTPESVVFRSKGGPPPALPAVPSIVKPDFTVTGKKDIRMVVNAADYNAALELAASSSGNGAVVIESFIPGYDASYLVWIDGGRATKLLSWDELNEFNSDRILKALGLVMPSSAAESGHEGAVLGQIEAFAALFPRISAILAFSFRIDAEGTPWMIEIHADLTGDLILDDLAPKATGANAMEAVARILLERDLGVFVKLTVSPTGILFSDLARTLKAGSVSEVRRTILQSASGNISNETR